MKKKNQRLQPELKIVKLKEELAEKKRELKIESALEKVRIKAMRMKKSDNMLDICKTISLQLESLGVKEIRNVQTAIFYQQLGTYMNYQYYSKHNITVITETNYTNNKLHKEFAEKMLRGKGEFFKTLIKGKKVKNWIAYQKTTNVFIDKYLETASSLNYYWFSLGPVALGISTYHPLTEVEIELFKRFLKVFELAYRRYLDIEKAEAQAREARIEASLERVRAIAMGMNKSEDLLSICEVSFKEFQKLGFNQLRNAVIHIPNDEQNFYMDYDYSESLGGAIAKIDYGSHPIVDEILEKIRSSKDAFIEVLIEENQLRGWREFRKKTGQQEDPRLDDATALYYYLFSIGIGDIGISTFNPIDESQIKILKRFRNVFELAYRRYLDIEKAEAQVREAQIEAALERVRSRSLAMHKSKELEIVITILLKQLEEVGILLDTASIVIPSKDKKTSVDWTASKKYKYSKGFIVPFMENGKPILSGEINRDIVAVLKSGKEFTKSYSRKEKNKYFQNLFDKSGFSETPEARKEFLLSLPGISVSTAGSKNSYIQIFSYSGQELSAPDLAVLKRFAMVFEQCYIRFQDLEKAEEQAREAQIEAALERVRSRSMGMHKSNELKDVVRLLYKEFRILVTDIDSVNIQLNLDSSKDIHFWASVEEDIYPELYHLPYSDLPIFEKFYNAFSSPGEGFFDYLSKKEEKDDFFNEVFKIQPVPPLRKKMIQNAEGMVMMGWFHRHSGVDIVRYNLQRFSEEEKDIVKRFAAAFEQTYIRFTDLQKAETQAREAEIEAALERVRSRTMAMQKSNELAETASHLFGQLNVLGIKPYRFNIAIVDTKSEKCQLWSTTNEGKVIPTGPLIPLKEYNVFNQMYDGWKQQLSVKVIRIEGEERITWTKYIMRYVSFDEYKPENIDLERLRHEPAIFSNFFFKQGFVVVHTIEEIDESDMKIIQRFVNVFEQTYTRFLDLEKAETQAREAKIEASLEKVRTVALTMKKSDEMLDIAQVLYEQLLELGFNNIRNAIIDLHNEKDKSFLDYDYSHDMGRTVTLMSYSDHPIIEEQVRQIQSSSDAFFELILEGQELQDLIDIRLKNGEAEDPRLRQIEQLTYNLYSFGDGAIGISNFGLLSEEQKIVLKRFRNVFTFAYKRYTDMVQAEAQAKEAVKQASLDRVRGEIASMRTAEDLNRITPIIWRELKTLEVPFIRCGVFIVNEDKENVQVYLTTPDGKSLGVLNLPFNSNKLTIKTVEYWKKKKVYKEHWSREEFINWTKSMMELGQVQNAETYQGSSNPPDSLHLHFVPFTQGMLYVGDVSPLTDEKLDLVKTLAEAFSIAYARYEDFKNLEDAKNKIEITLTDLKSAQVQLVHSEKMASLGELTAGIAHEIKNPLNFVNNFSEISRELLDEMKVEIQNKNLDEVIELIEDLKQNLEKINQHGKRADSIVKGMLLHSRGTSGEKTPTDINDLLEQYVNLAYHGMRAQNKEFNITIEKDYDESLEKINVVPQDISRVFLNIVNNACYAAYDRKKKGSDNNFSPTLKVSTKNLKDKIEIRIGDNGNGIPKDILDKIFQPFFTTKPTGEGTGLGLSLSYDIVVKQHGGQLKVETTEGEGTKFMLILNI